MNQNALSQYLSQRIPQFGAINAVRKFDTGQSNPTYLIETHQKRYVLRSKPAGKLLKSAHQVDREFRVMQALAGSKVPVPQVHVLCDLPNPLNTMFFVMAHVEGDIHWDPALPTLTKAQRKNVYRSLCETVAALHQINPDDIGMADFGAPGNYFERQLGRWSKQYAASEITRNNDVHWLIDWLNEHKIADDGQVAIVHGDYRIDNIIFSPTGQVNAVLDWELSTLGHPMADIAYQAMQWRLPNKGRSMGLMGIARTELGIPKEEEYLAQYCDFRGINIPTDWNFYLVFSYFRLIAILQGVIRRAADGNASNPQGVEGFKQAIPVLVQQALEIAKGPR